MYEIKQLMEIISQLPKKHFTEKEILEMIIRNTDYGIMFEIETDDVNNQIIYTINNDIAFYDYIDDVKLQYKYYVFYLKKEEVDLLEYILKRFF